MKQSKLPYIFFTMTCFSLGTKPLATRGDSHLVRQPSSVSLEFSLLGDRIEARTPIVARVTLTNLGDEQLTLRTRAQGTPYAIHLVVIYENQQQKKMSLWLRRSGPITHDVILASNESITGEILLFDRNNGFPIETPGKYRILFCWTSNDGRENVCTEQLKFEALPQKEQNITSLIDLQDIAIDFYSNGAASKSSIDPIEMDKARAFYGIKLLTKTMGQHKPHLIDPQRNTAVENEANLVNLFEDWLNRHPNSSYSGYVEQYLGLVYLKTLEHEWSLAQRGSWKEAVSITNKDDITLKVLNAYDKALSYLTMADEANIWPRTLAIYYLGHIHALTEKWDKANNCLTELRTTYATSNGVPRADELERQMAKYKTKLERRKVAAP